MLALTRTLTISLVVLYALLGVLAVVCPVDSFPSAMGHHQHGQAHHGGGGHGALCVLACQTNSPTGLVSALPDDRPVWLFLWAIVAPFVCAPLLQENCIRARAPPR